MMQKYIIFWFKPKQNQTFSQKKDEFGKDFVFLQFDKK
jgi:hypothetical protein